MQLSELRKIHREYQQLRRYGLAGYARRVAATLQLKDTAAWRTVDGTFEMELGRTDPTDVDFFLGTFDRKLVHLIRHLVHDGDACIDIGGHKGYVSLHLASRVGPRGRVFTFEPDPRARGFLTRNCARNGASQVTVFDCALGKSAGEVTLQLSTQLGWSSQYPNELSSQFVMEAITVPVRAVDDIVGAKEIDVTPSRLSFVKIDCEGAEPLVLAGMTRLLTDASPVLFVEINRGSLRAAGSTASDITDAVTRLGYRVYVPRGRRAGKDEHVTLDPLARLAEGSLPWCFDVVAFKPDAMARIARAGISIAS